MIKEYEHKIPTDVIQNTITKKKYTSGNKCVEFTLYDKRGLLGVYVTWNVNGVEGNDKRIFGKKEESLVKKYIFDWMNDISQQINIVIDDSIIKEIRKANVDELDKTLKDLNEAKDEITERLDEEKNPKNIKTLDKVRSKMNNSIKDLEYCNNTIKKIWANYQIPEPTEDMIEFFHKRTDEHIDRVVSNMTKLAEYYKYPELIERGMRHDASKFEDNEYIPYVWLTEYYRCLGADVDFEFPVGVEDYTEEACEHHYCNNRHHPEFHEDCNDMTFVDLAEMVSDWTSLSQEKGEANGSAKPWADKVLKNENKWGFCEEKTEQIYDLISILDKLNGGN